MKLERISIMVFQNKIIFTSIVVAVASCHNNTNTKNTTTKEQAIPKDQETKLYYVQKNEARGDFVLLTNGKQLAQRQGYKIWCGDIRTTQPLLNAIGFSDVEVAFALREPIKADDPLLINSQWEKNPVLSCDYGSEAKLFKVNYGNKFNKHFKYFINFKDNLLKDKLFNIGCPEVLSEMGFDINSAKVIDKENADIFLNKSDMFDINCVSGSNFPASLPTCPVGFIPVPGNKTVMLGGKHNTSGVKPFCVMKYEAKCLQNNTDNRCATNSLPISTPYFQPWSLVDHPGAKQACENLGEHFKLITNPQWMTIARNLELQPQNWTGGIVGSGTLYIGHTDLIPRHPIAASFDDNSGYYGTENNTNQNIGQGKQERRTMYLSNGEIIWDFSGNMREWIYEDVTTIGFSIETENSWENFNNLDSLKRILIAPQNPDFNTMQGVGRYIFDTERGDKVFRGGYYGGENNYSGIFNMYLGSGASYINAGLGFRCTYNPPLK